MVRTPSFDKNGIKKGAWSPEEDRKLEAYISRYGHWNWRELPKYAGLKRCGKSCRLRWMNYLRPNVKRGNYTKLEEDLIMELHQKHGNKWAMIASKLPGRTDNEIKNHWHTHLKKRRLTENALTASSDRSQRSSDGVDNSDSESSQKFVSSTSHVSEDCFQHIQILESCPFSPQMSSADISLSSSTSTVNYGGFEEIMSSTNHQFFAELTSPSDLLDPQMDNGSLFALTNGEMGGETASLMAVFGELEDDEFWSKPFNMEDMMSYTSFIHNSSDDDNSQLLSSCMIHYDQSIQDLLCD